MACRYLRERGAQIVARNFRCRGGEIDIVARHGGHLLFVEVRLRRSPRFGTGAESVVRNKQRRLVRAALSYLQSHPSARTEPMRFDVISILANTQPHSVEWIRDAFPAAT